jgi:hypothetical protein
MPLLLFGAFCVISAGIIILRNIINRKNMLHRILPNEELNRPTTRTGHNQINTITNTNINNQSIPPKYEDIVPFPIEHPPSYEITI